MIRKIKNSIEKLQNKPEDTKIKTVWIMAVFCVIVVFGIWSLNLKGFKKDISSDYEKLPNFGKQISDIGDAFDKIEDSSKIVSSQIDQEEIIIIANNYIKENNLLTKDDLGNIAIDSVEKIDNMWIVNYFQYYESIPLDESKIYLKISDEDKTIVDYNLNYLTDIKIDTDPEITNVQAYDIILKDLDGDNLELKSSNLVVCNILNEEEENDYYLAWKMNLYSVLNKTEYYYYINADSGKIIDFLRN